MALIVFHAGMPKSGSTTIQRWLADHLPLLASHGIQCVRVFQPSPTDPITLRPATATSAVSQFVANDVPTRPAVAEQICAALDAQAAHADVIVVSSESYAVFFNAPGRGAVLAHFDELARAHSLRIAYYVRPQHSWLESAWLQWGFRNPAPPEVWIQRQRQKVDHLETLQVVREAAPHLSFDIRPFRADLLEGGHVASDFARTFLGLEDLPADGMQERWSNRSLPLEAAILLRHAPSGLFWANPNDNSKFYPLKRLMLEWDLPQTEVANRSREVLQRYAHETFEPGNQQLIRELGWNTDHFVPPIDGATDVADAGLAQLNVLWESAASEAERQIVFSALHQLLSDPTSS